jgi:hypothetical protein
MHKLSGPTIIPEVNGIFLLSKQRGASSQHTTFLKLAASAPFTCWNASLHAVSTRPNQIMSTDSPGDIASHMWRCGRQEALGECHLEDGQQHCLGNDHRHSTGRQRLC